MVNIKFDQYGLVVQTDGDGGDSGARTGLYYFLIKFLDPNNDKQHAFYTALANCRASENPDMYFRNPVNYNQPEDFSRDQTNPLLMAMGMYDMDDKLIGWWKGLIKRFDRYQNADYAGPQDWGMYIRARKLKHLAFLLPIFDISLIIGSIIRCIAGRKFDDVGDDINHTMLLMQAIKVYSTPVSYIARFIYSKFRPRGVQYAWDWYFRPESYANPFNELARPILQEYFT